MQQKSDTTKIFKIICCVCDPNFINFGEHFRKFYKFWWNGEREMRGKEIENDTRGMVAKI